jgi:hypothetical protein
MEPYARSALSLSGNSPVTMPDFARLDVDVSAIFSPLTNLIAVK